MEFAISHGEDCGLYMATNSIAEDLSTYAGSGQTMDWKSDLGDIPIILEPQEFERWLWDRVMPEDPKVMANLRVRYVFPELANVLENHGEDGQSPVQWRCFLGRIRDAEKVDDKMVVEVMDVAGEDPVFFTCALNNTRDRRLEIGEL